MPDPVKFPNYRKPDITVKYDEFMRLVQKVEELEKLITEEKAKRGRPPKE